MIYIFVHACTWCDISILLTTYIQKYLQGSSSKLSTKLDSSRTYFTFFQSYSFTRHKFKILITQIISERRNVKKRSIGNINRPWVTQEIRIVPRSENSPRKNFWCSAKRCANGFVTNLEIIFNYGFGRNVRVLERNVKVRFMFVVPKITRSCRTLICMLRHRILLSQTSTNSWAPTSPSSTFHFLEISIRLYVLWNLHSF